MRPWARRSSVAAVVVLAVACSGPGMTDEGFISLGRDNGEGVGAAPATGGFAGTDMSTGDDAGTAGTIFPQGGTEGGPNGGTSTGANGGTSTGAEGGEGTGGTSTGANGGTAGNSNGGTSTGGDGPSCGSGGMPKITSPIATGDEILDACGRAGPNGRICLADDSAWYCGGDHYAVIEYCRLGTCESGCCHATSDPCPNVALDSYDCHGDCAGFRGCSHTSFVNLTLPESGLRVVRVGGFTMGERCGMVARRYFELFLSGPWARVTVSPPWFLAEGFTCADATTSVCLLSDSEASSERSVVVMTDADPPPPRNVVIETSLNVLTCPLQY